MYIKGFRQKHKWNYYIRWGFVLLSLAGLVGCSPIPVEQSYQPCNPENGNAYIYTPEMLPLIKEQLVLVQPNLVADLLFTPAPTAIQTADPMGFINGMLATVQAPSASPTTPQARVFQYMVHETKHTTDIMTIDFGNSEKAYVVVTFLSPLLIQTVYFSDYIYKIPSMNGFEASLNSSINKVIQRRELLFLVTIASSNYDSFSTLSNTLKVPINSMVLANSDGLKISPKHYDRNLDEAFITSQIFESGILGYSLGVQDNGRCSWVLDPTYNQNIVIVGSNIDNGTGKPLSHTWTIPYESLVNPAGSTIPDTELLQYYNQTTSISPIDTPPLAPVNYESDPIFWQNLARFIWGRVIQGH